MSINNDETPPEDMPDAGNNPDGAETVQENTGAGQPTPTDPYTRPTTTDKINNLAAAIKLMECDLTRDGMKKELGDQQDTNKDRLQDMVWGGTDPIVFGFMKPNSPFIQVLHSPAKYVGCRHGFDEHNMKHIAFVGDRRKNMEPTPCEIILKTFKEWNKVTTPDMDALGLFYQDTAKRLSFFPLQDTDVSTEAIVPKFILLPSCVVGVVAEGNCTPYELLGHVMRCAHMPNETQDQIDEWDRVLKNLITWIMAACVEKVATTGVPNVTHTSRLAWPLTVIVTDNAHTIRWIKRRLEETLGPVAEASFPKGLPPPVYPVYQSPPNQPMAATHATIPKSATYSPLRLTALAYYCGVTHHNNIPDVWHDLEGSTAVDEWRIIINDAIETAATTMRTQPNRFYLADDSIKDIQKMKFSPGATAIFDSLEKGISILLCLPRRPETVADLEREARCEEETRGTRTLAESRTLSKKDPRSPARSYHGLLANIASYATLLLALFGESCGHYKGVTVLFEIIQNLHERQSYFTHLYCKEITFAIIDDSRRFFSTSITTEKFNAGIYHNTLTFPTSMLQLVAQDVTRLKPVQTRDFPTQWKDIVQDKNKRSWNQDPPDGRNTPSGRGNPKGVLVGPHRGWITTGHPKIMKMMEPYRAIFERVQLTGIMTCARRSLADLPKFRDHINSRGQSTLCNHHLLGKCTPFNGRCEFDHIDPNTLDDGFVKKYCQIIAPGIDEMCMHVSPNDVMFGKQRGRQRRN